MTMSKTRSSKLNDWFKLSSGETKPNNVEDAPSDKAMFPVFGGNGVIGWSSQSNASGENIIIGRVGAKCGCVHYYKGKCWITDNALYTKEHKRDYDKRFMAVLLSYVGLERLRSETGQPLISQGPVHSLNAAIPCIKDQQSIALLALTWDTAIEKTEKLIKEKRLWHVTLSNKLLSRKYNNVSLTKFLTLVVRNVVKPDKPYWALGIRSHGKGTFRRFVENPEAVAMDTLYRVQHNDIIINITFAWEGAIALVKEADEDCLVSHRFPTFEVDINKALPDYLRHVIVQKWFIRNLGLISPGGAGRNRVLNKKDFLNLKISLPEIKEQERIGNVLNTSLKEISLLEAQLELLKKQKRGLMQKLLTGKWHVKVEDVLG